MSRKKTEDLLPKFSANPPVDKQAIEKFERESHVRLPEDYVHFLKRMNGGDGFIGKAYVILYPLAELLSLNEGYGQLAPGFFVFGSDGGGEAFGFDIRTGANDVTCLPFVVMDWRDAVRIAPTFTTFLDVVSRSWPDIIAQS